MPQTTTPRTVFITGGMSGLGKALALQYLARGASVAVFDLQVDAEVLAALRGLCRVDSQQALAYAANVTRFEELDAAVEAAEAALGKPELAISCAGINRAFPFEALSGAQFEQVMSVNVLGSRNFAQAVLSRMERGARLALVASMAGFVANYSYAAYSASKFAVVGLGRVLRLEYKPKGIEISLICPPEVDTPMVEDELKHMHPVSKALKRFGGSLSLDQAIREILRGLDRGRGVIIPGGKAKVTYFCNRYLPDVLMNAVVDRIVRSVLREMQDEEARVRGKSP